MPSKKKIDPRQRGEQPADLHGNETPRDPIKRGHSWRVRYRDWDSSWKVDLENEEATEGQRTFAYFTFTSIRDTPHYRHRIRRGRTGGPADQYEWTFEGEPDEVHLIRAQMLMTSAAFEMDLPENKRKQSVWIVHHYIAGTLFCMVPGSDQDVDGIVAPRLARNLKIPVKTVNRVIEKYHAFRNALTKLPPSRLSRDEVNRALGIRSLRQD